MIASVVILPLDRINTNESAQPIQNWLKSNVGHGFLGSGFQQGDIDFGSKWCWQTNADRTITFRFLRAADAIHFKLIWA